MMSKNELLVLMCEYLSNQADSVKKVDNEILSISNKLVNYDKTLAVLNDSKNKNYVGNSNLIINSLYREKAELELELQVLKLLKGEE